MLAASCATRRCWQTALTYAGGVRIHSFTTDARAPKSTLPIPESRLLDNAAVLHLMIRRRKDFRVRVQLLQEVRRVVHMETHSNVWRVVGQFFVFNAEVDIVNQDAPFSLLCPLKIVLNVQIQITALDDLL